MCSSLISNFKVKKLVLCNNVRLNVRNVSLRNKKKPIK